jgi:hypothetical protein
MAVELVEAGDAQVRLRPFRCSRGRRLNMEGTGAREGVFWAVSSYFNPGALPGRLTNYRRFRRHMVLPLMTIELAFGDTPFVLGGDDAEFLVQLRGGDVMWQKERLLDLAISRLPASCRYVAWIDCDVVFALPDWPELAMAALGRSQLVQLFEAVHYLRREASDFGLDVAHSYATRIAMAASLARGARVDELLADGDRKAFASTSPGFAWAMARETIERCGLFDTCIVGGGDRAMIAAVFGEWDHVIRRQRMTAGHAEAFREWGGRFRDAVDGEVGSIPGDLFHCWHGSVEKRRMRERYEEIAPFDFDPARDIGRTESGVWEWTSDKPELHRVVASQFRTRYEDA